ncbi:helix-turn-helix- domain containing protein AraC type [Planctopirus limnophila DSM 3776]|uniref:Helix-turn-helix-domain containing protein AraC type n=1 Tax=Planctopirus limnophila (strain ATCC 43296 / DSM 3776 / IFAM 1008 / Mu 290) TaxID=521674 RepID=D5SRD0_PLAL2|nr:DNA-binding transcriptional regulator [Planctopirus limnophila]ADG68623.1 helix-turn-helix- domain containing protein AraC type [Planctopirus limnophila DSM 3776]
MQTPPRLRVALLIESSNAYARGVLMGIQQYVRQQHRRWSIHLTEQGRGDAPPEWLSKTNFHGVIARVETPLIAERLQALKIPVVDVSAARLWPQIPWVETDDVAIAEMAVAHLLERGFQNFAYCGDSSFNWSNWRKQAFLDAVLAAGGRCEMFDHQGLDPEVAEKSLIEWLRLLPKPVGVMGCYDSTARQVLDACRDLGLSVPDDVAVIGVDNDELLCELADPPLTSIAPNAVRAGAVAAQFLDEQMQGVNLKEDCLRVPPLGVITRQSTDVLALDDRDVALALRFIREHAFEGIHVNDVLKIVPLSRRVLEQRFERRLGRTPHAEILRLKLERARQLMVETDLSLSTIAHRSGFAHDEYFSVAFKRAMGVAPSVWRREQTEPYRR